MPRAYSDDELSGDADSVTNRQPKNIAASVRARLTNRSRETGEEFQFLLQRYASERFLYRLGVSEYRERFVLKGAMLFALWGGSLYRPTRDLDFTGYGSQETEEVMRIMRTICEHEVADDGIRFDVSKLTATPIRNEAEYDGLRIRFQAMLSGARIPMQIDVGFGNAIEPPAADADYPTLLDASPPHIRAYPHEAVVAEKLHAMVILGESNSRYKDFYDLYVLATQFPFEGKSLTRAIDATFTRRKTKIESDIPAALTPRFYANDIRISRWQAYVKSSSLPGASSDYATVGEMLIAFLLLPFRELANGNEFSYQWSPSGPWNSTVTEPKE